MQRIERPWLFFLIAFGWTWLVGWPLALSSRGLLPWRLHPALHLLMAFGPLFGALAAVPSRRAFLRQALAARPRRWLLVGALGPIAAYLAAASVATALRAAGLAGPAAGASVWPGPGALFAIVGFFLTFGLGEEVGWRGYLLPRLERGLAPHAATLALAVIWGAWHLPLIADLDAIGGDGPLGIARFAVSLTAGAFILTWIAHGARGSALACALFHGVLNGVSATVDDRLTSDLVTVLFVLGAAALVATGALRAEDA